MIVDRTQVSLEDVLFRLAALAQLRDSPQRADRKHADAVLYNIVLPGLRAFVEDESHGFEIEEFQISGDVVSALAHNHDPSSEIPTRVNYLDTFQYLYERLLDYNQNQAACRLAELGARSLRRSYVSSSRLF
ncbi:hypothetical protein HYW21_06055 [Candidatus Woesearchaeota archaeon]|nr:hypothetical protein [Candidatus Woesearchaeota archaeon]